MAAGYLAADHGREIAGRALQHARAGLYADSAHKAADNRLCHARFAGRPGWLIEKRRAWSDCGGDVEAVFSKDDLITTAMHYWLTDTYVSSARHYYEAKPERLAPCHDRQPPVEAPTALLQFKGDFWLQPRKWAERYYNPKRWSVAEKGGHFAPMEMPELLVDDLRQFFRTLRNDID